MKVDLNSDLGESFGRYKLGLDEEVMKYITSANVATGWHAGDPLVMRKTVRLAKENGVAVGAHPGYPDLLGFGRRYMKLSPFTRLGRFTPLLKLRASNSSTLSPTGHSTMHW